MLWMLNPAMSKLLRPNRSTVKVLTRTMTSCSAAWMPLMARAWCPASQPSDL